VGHNSNLDLEITFYPLQKDLNLHYKNIPCLIKGGYKLELSLMSKSVNLDISSNEKLAYDTIVRKNTLKNVTFYNTKERELAINPTYCTEGETAEGFFKGKSALIALAKGSVL